MMSLLYTLKFFMLDIVDNVTDWQRSSTRKVKMYDKIRSNIQKVMYQITIISCM